MVRLSCRLRAGPRKFQASDLTIHSSRCRFAARLNSGVRHRGDFVAPEILTGVVVAIAVVTGVVAILMPKRKPPSAVFKCGRCGAAARHNDRTSEAWRNGKSKFFCQTCHARWLQSRPPQERESYSASGRGSGCLGAIVLFSLLPFGGLLAWAYA